MRTPIITLAAVVIASCSQADSNERSDSPSKPENLAQIATTDRDILRVCVAGAAFNVGRSTEGIESSIRDGIVRLDYTRDDGKKFEYDCKI